MSGGKMGEKETGRQTVIARPVRFKQEGFERYLFCVHPHITCDGPVKGLWTVSEYRTGISVLMGMRGKTPKQALKLAKAVLGKAGPEKFKAAVNHALSIYGPRN